MPTPRAALIKNASGLLQEGALSSRKFLHSRIRSPSSIHRQESHSAQRSSIHISSRAGKQRDIDSDVPPASQPIPTARTDFLADLTASAWSTSPINTGYPFYNEFPSFNPLPSTHPIEASPARIPDFDISFAYWSFSPINTGAWISDDSIFAIKPRFTFPLRSPEAYDNIMASDEDYTAFLDKAAADGQPTQKAQSKPATQQKTVNTSSVHSALHNVHQHTYVSDADEAFEPVSLSRASGKSGAVDKSEVAQLASASEGKVEEMSKKDFDPRGEYEAVWKAVSDASEGGVKAFKIERSGTRSEYWVLGVGKDGHVVGAKANSVES